MTVTAVSFRLFAVFFLCVAGFPASLDAQSDFSFQLKESGLTSAGIFDSNQRIVRTLWALETFKAGGLSGSWDGLDDFGIRFLRAATRGRSFATAPNTTTSGSLGTRACRPLLPGTCRFSSKEWRWMRRAASIQSTTGTSLILT